ncbi:MAG: hypothetical protein Q7V57_17800 [Actinomycetota bacterium]|nr:hypothetical protein [Actinomycetota bacterium]
MRADQPQGPAGRRLAHSLTPRLLTITGATASTAVLGEATVAALRASDWEQPWPVLEPRLALLAAFTLVAAVWWAAVAAVNARRLTTLRVVGVATTLAYAVPVGAWFGLDRLVEGDVRRWAWVGWVALVLAVHSLVVTGFRRTSATLGEPNSHFTAVALLPIGAAAAAVPSVFHQAAVFALPTATGFAVWLLVELGQAMTVFDGDCRARWHQLHGVPLPSAAPPTVSAESGADHRHHHTTLPRLLVLASFLAGLSAPLWVWLLERRGHVALIDRRTVFDDQGRRVMAVLFAAALATYAVGWLWWAVAAAANAANRARWAISPFLAPFGYAMMVGAIAALPEVEERVKSEYHTLVQVAAGLVVVVAHFGVVQSYRSTAERIGARLAPWTRLIYMPQGALVLSVLLGFFGQTLGDGAFIGVLGTTWAVVYLAYAVSFQQAMVEFDKACYGHRLTSADGGALPDFLKNSSLAADS